MYYLKIFLITLPIIFLWNTLSAQPESGKAYLSIESEVDVLMKNAVQKFNIPGVTVAVTKNGKLVVNKAYGYANYKRRVPMKPTHRTNIASIAKVITALGFMKLTEEKPNISPNMKVFGSAGALREQIYLDAIIDGSNHFNHSELISWYNKMRVNHILSHTAGCVNDNIKKEQIMDYLNLRDSPKHLRQSIRAQLARKRLLFEPGTRKAYSNHAMGNLLKHIIEVNSAMDYGYYIDKRIFRPLGLHGDIVNNKHRKDKYDSNRHKLVNGKIETLEWPDDYTYGLNRVGAAGGWAASARSLVRLAVATDKHSNYPDILQRRTIDLMESQPYPSTSDFALGWGYQANGKKIAHNGSGGGGKAYLVKYKSGSEEGGIDVSNINVAICVNYQDIDMAELSKLYKELAKIVGRKSIPTSYDLFPETDPNPPSGAYGQAGTISKLVKTYTWSRGWSIARSFNVGGQYYLLLIKEKGYNSKGKNLHVNKVNSDGSIGSLVFSYRISEGWSDAEFFKTGNKLYLFLIKEQGFTSEGKNVHINLMNNDGTVGPKLRSYKWSFGWSDAEFYKKGGQTYLMLLKKKGYTSAGKNVHINKVNSNGSIGAVIDKYRISEGWTDADFYYADQQTFLFLIKSKGFTSKGKNVHINQMNNDGKIGKLRWSYRWGQGWTDASFYSSGSKKFLFLLKEKGYSDREKNAHVNQINSNGSIGRLEASYTWSQNWSQSHFWRKNNDTFLFLLKENGLTNKGKNVHINRVN